MTILITGGAGSLATDFINYYLSTSSPEKVVLLDVKTPKLEDGNYSDLLSFIHADCANLGEVEDVFRTHEITRILHFAGSVESGSEGFVSNVVSTINVVKLSEKYGLPKLFYPQSFLTRDCSKAIDEESEATSLDSDYSIFKHTAEQFVRMYKGSFTIGIVSSSVSPTLSIGPIPAFAKRISEGREITISDTERDYISPESCAQAIEMASRVGFEKIQVVIGSGVSTHTRDLAKEVCNVLGIEVALPEVSTPKLGDPKKVKFKPSGSLIDLGWNPKSYSLEDISKVVEATSKGVYVIRQHHV